MSEDVTGRVALVTGATDGIGELTARRLAADGATVLVHGRNPGKVERVVEMIRGDGGDAQGVVADLAAVARVRRLADTVLERTPRLDILINNAGVGDPRGPRRESDDGHELHFAVNALAPVLLTRLLSDLLADTARSRGEARVVMVASAAQSPIDFDDPQLRHGYDGMLAYAQSKLALVMATIELAERLQSRGVIVNALHPGTLLDTKMVREGFGRAHGPAADGAEAEVHLATASALAGVTGHYFDRFERAEPAVQARDPQARRRLMDLIRQLTGAG
ncbi:SDR family NAD(P)-dependent oxidoreductase [uncultured Thiohalocapsa sp.]|uniref:SDR family NAD(P)-dependent oxidoreductase n=1 Tax=uncultured Thiohalocapsa sp. TaxID=768990 RepID=UPI0025F3E30A|nr:SDR family NAD(P)-dependent oxidoreductase [uncultured Thiohalocapsa sp.]